MNAIPEPSVMPVDREAWRKEINLSNFVNSAYQLRDVRMCGEVRSLLIIGPGQGLDTEIFKWLGYDVTTFDIDPTFQPDHVGSVHDLSRFANAQFDAVIASHVLEHMAVPYLDPALAEIARVGRHAIVYLPVHGRHLQLRFIPGVRAIDASFVLDVFNWFERPDGVTAKYMSGQHYWEIGMRGFRKRDLLRRFSKHFEVLRAYRNRDWLSSYNFVLRSRAHREQKPSVESAP